NAVRGCQSERSALGHVGRGVPVSLGCALRTLWYRTPCARRLASRIARRGPPVHPVLFRIPGLDLPLHTYGVMIVSGFLLAMFVAYRQAQRIGELEDEVLDVAFWCLVGGLIGARVVFIIVNWRQYFVEQFWDTEYTFLPSILVVWKGG